MPRVSEQQPLPSWRNLLSLLLEETSLFIHKQLPHPAAPAKASPQQTAICVTLQLLQGAVVCRLLLIQIKHVRAPANSPPHWALAGVCLLTARQTLPVTDPSP